LQPNSKIGVGIYTVNSEHKFEMSMKRICLERGWDVLDQRGQPLDTCNRVME